MTARPLILPQVTIEFAGRRLNDAELGALGEIRVQQQLSLPTMCELTFFTALSSSSPLSSVVAGLSLEIRLSEESEPLFRGEITALEYAYEPAHGRSLRVRGYDRLHRLGKRQPVRTHVRVGLIDVARELTQDLGISVEAPLSGVQWRHLIQHGQTDLEFLNQRAEACGLYLTLRGDVVRFVTLEGDGEAVPLRLGESLLEARVEVNGESSCREVSAAGWDPLRIETHLGRSGQARMGRSVSARVPEDWIGGAEERYLVSRPVEDESQAEALAQADLDLRAASEVTLWGLAEGDARLAPGMPIEVEGLAPELEGRYVLTRVTHLFDSEHRYVTEIATRPPAPTPRAGSASVVLGVVTRVNDPEGLGRVKVSLPACGDLETDWMQVLTPGGGAGKGLMTLADVGDQVLVICAQGDPAQGIVLGGVYGMKGSPDSGVEGENVKRFTLLTPGGQRVRLDDQKKSIRLENSSGSYVELRPGKVVLHAKTDLCLEAPGQTIAIRGKAINFEEA